MSAILGEPLLDDAVEDVGIDRRQQLAVVAQRVLLHLVGNRAVALALHDVEHGLGSDELGERA